MTHPFGKEQKQGLTIKKGITTDAPSVNPYFKKIVGQKPSTITEFTEGIFRGDIAILSQAVTLIESSKPEHQQQAQKIIEQCLPYSGKSVRVGITGVPGAGKSTSIDAFGMHLVQKGHKLAVLAIDPSSERTKGSILGDKTRMGALAREKNVFIRPSPSAGTLGGVARKTRETIVLCEAAGFDTLFVETVGVGQSETAIHSMVDFFLLIQLAGAGDELQGIKRGIMELADGIVINKSDNDNIERANLAAGHLRNAMNLFPPTDSGWKPKVLTYSGYYNIGIAEIWEMIDEYVDCAKSNGYFESRRIKQEKYWMYESIHTMLDQAFYQHPQIKHLLPNIEQKVLLNEISPFIAARQLLALFLEKPEVQ